MGTKKIVAVSDVVRPEALEIVFCGQEMVHFIQSADVLFGRDELLDVGTRCRPLIGGVVKGWTSVEGQATRGALLLCSTAAAVVHALL